MMCNDYVPTPCNQRGLEHDWYDAIRKGRITKRGQVLEVYRCARCGRETERVR